MELGQAWLSAGKPANAIGALQEAVKREPDSPAALLNLADALTEAGQPGRAVAVADHGVSVAPNDALLWMQLGIACSSAGQQTEAIAAYEKPGAADPDLAESRKLLGTVRRRNCAPTCRRRSITFSGRSNSSPKTQRC